LKIKEPELLNFYSDKFEGVGSSKLFYHQADLMQDVKFHFVYLKINALILQLETKYTTMQ